MTELRPRHLSQGMRTVQDLALAMPWFGDRPCVAFRTDFRVFRFSYREVFDHIQKDIISLKEWGVRKGDPVVLWAPNSPGWVSMFLACACIGAPVVPLDARGSVGFAQAVCRQVHPRVMVCSGNGCKARFSCMVVEVSPVWIPAALPINRPVPAKDLALPHVRPQDILEIVYTSGTTGDPKGVMLSHENVVVNAKAATVTIPIGPDDSSVSLLPLSHMFEQVSNMIVPFMHGSRVVFLDRLNRRFISEALREEKPSYVPIVPRLLDMIKSGIEQAVPSPILTRLQGISGSLPCSVRSWCFPFLWRRWNPGVFRFFICGGAPLDPETEVFFERLGLVILQGYGLTETSPVLTMNTPIYRRLGSVGKPVPGVQVRIAPDGEVLAKGVSVTKGYFRNPEKTKELFRHGWLATGDLGLWDSQGFLVLHGRKKDLIVTAEGTNVYPEDVEAVLNRMPQVKDSAVVGLTDKSGEQVHAVLLLKKDATALYASPRVIVEKANSLLGAHQRITGFTVWPHDDFPRTPTMKVKKFEVLNFLKQGMREVKSSKSLTVKEAQSRPLYGIIARVTKKRLEALKPWSNLTSDLGLSSLDRVELLAAIEDELGVYLPDEVVTPLTRVADIEKLVAGVSRVKGGLPFRQWVRSWPAGVLRWIIRYMIVFPFTRLYTRPQVVGFDHASSLNGPVLIVCNHTSHADSVVLFMSLPQRLAARACPVALLEFFRSDNPIKNALLKVLYEWVCLAGLAIPFPQTAGFGEAMRYAGRMVDKRYSIVIFPEGARSLDKKIHAFKQGVGLLAVHLKIPVLPVRFRGLDDVLPRSAAWPRRAKSIITFGEPFFVGSNDVKKATEEIEERVRKL